MIQFKSPNSRLKMILIGWSIFILLSLSELHPLAEESHSAYTLGAEDVIKISVWQHPEFSEELTVDTAGNITLPLLGDFKVEGMTKEELEKKLGFLLREYVYEPEVKVSITQYKSKYIYILGEVRQPVKYPLLKDQLTLKEALYRAGLPTSTAALRRVRIISSDRSTPVKIVDVHKILYKGDSEKGLLLYPSDTVYVPPTIPTKISRFLSGLTEPISRFLFFEF